jgi:hypothetical protein
MQEICQSGSEGGAKLTFVPTPISAQGFNPGNGPSVAKMLRLRAKDAADGFGLPGARGNAGSVVARNRTSPDTTIACHQALPLLTTNTGRDIDLY